MKIESAAFEASAALSSQLPPSVLPEIAFAGRSNVGKSSLINKLVNRKALARTSATPGKTATINFYRLDTLRLVDLPGYGYAKVSGAEKRRWSDLIEGYFQTCASAERDLRLTLLLVDMRHPPSRDDRLMMDYLAQMTLPFLVVLTKADKLNKSERATRMEALNEELSAYEGLTLLPFSVVTGENVEELRGILESVID